MLMPTFFWLLLCNEHSVDNDMMTHKNNWIQIEDHNFNVFGAG